MIEPETADDPSDTYSSEWVRGAIECGCARRDSTPETDLTEPSTMDSSAESINHVCLHVVAVQLSGRATHNSFERERHRR